MFDSVRQGLTLWYVSVLALVLAAFSLGVYSMSSRALCMIASMRACAAVVQVAHQVSRERPGRRTDTRTRAQSTVAELFDPQQALAVFDDSPGGCSPKTLRDDDFYARLPDHVVSYRTTGIYLYTADDEYDRRRASSHGGPARHDPAPEHALHHCRRRGSLERIEEELESLSEILYYTVPVALLMAGIGGWFLARKSLAPVVSMAEQARRIGAESLDQRLLVANPRDEIGPARGGFQRAASRLSAALRSAAAVHGRRLARAAHSALRRAHRRRRDAREASPGRGRVPGGD